MLVLVFFLAGCAPAEFDETALSGESKAYTQSLIDGDYDSVAAGVSAPVSDRLNADILRQGWENIAPVLGGFEQIEDATFTEDGNSAVVGVTCAFANRNLLLTYTFNGKGEIAGLWMTYLPKPARPQETDAYKEKIVSVGNEDAPLEGILTMPKGAENPPAVLIVAGSGQQDMDETVGAAGNKPLADLAHGLAEHGIASLRYNKRTAQYPNLPQDPKDITIQYEVLDDAAAGAELLKNTEGIDARHIYVLGHSLGGMLAPKIAQDNGLAGLISLAGSPRSLEDIMLDQNRAAIEAAEGVSDQDRQAALAQAGALAEAAKNAKEGGTGVILNATENYWYTLNQVDTPGIVQSLDIPMLFLQGDADFQVSPEADFGAWKELLSGRQNAAFKLYPGLNHLFMPAGETGTASDYDAPASVDPQVTEDISSWIFSGD